MLPITKIVSDFKCVIKWYEYIQKQILLTLYLRRPASPMTLS